MKISSKIIACLSVITIVFSSCDDFFEVKPDDKLSESEHYSKVSEVYAAFVGTAAVFQDAAAHTVLLNELLGDNILPTIQAPQEYWDIARYQVSSDNTLLSPEAYYKIIINCNDFLRHAVVFNETHPNAIAEAYYKGMISQAINFRAWSYLMIGKIYGKVVYYDYALADDTDLSQCPVYAFDELLPVLADFLQNGVNGINGFNGLDWTGFLNLTDVSWNRVSVDANVLLGEIYLWMGDYQNAIRYLTQITNITTGDETNRWKLSSSFSDTKWSNIFSTSITGNTGETITVVPFDKAKKQENQLFYDFLYDYNLMPSDSLVSRFENQRTKNNLKGDRYRGNGSSYLAVRTEHGLKGAVAAKYLSASTCINIYRAADVHLMLAEALAGMQRFEEAMIIMNQGFVGGDKKYWTTVDGKSFRLPPMNDPIYNDNWRNNLGVRGRVNLAAVDYRSLLPENPTEQDKYRAVLQCIADEVSLELAFEGKRWSTLVRMARNLNDPSFLLDNVLKKFSPEERGAYRDLLTQNGYFLDYPQINVK